MSSLFEFLEPNIYADSTDYIKTKYFLGIAKVWWSGPCYWLCSYLSDLWITWSIPDLSVCYTILVFPKYPSYSITLLLYSWIRPSVDNVTLTVYMVKGRYVGTRWMNCKNWDTQSRYSRLGNPHTSNLFTYIRFIDVYRCCVSFVIFHK